MWTLYQMGKNQGTRPSSYVGITDLWVAYQFDRAVNTFGVVIDNASQEMHNVGSEKAAKYEPLYQMEQLLDVDFRLPRPKTAEDKERDSITALKNVARESATVKVFKVEG